MSEDIAEDTSEGSDDVAPTFAEVTVKGPGVSITRRVDEATMASVIALLFGAAPAAPAGRYGAGGRGTQQDVTGNAANSRSQPEWDARMTLGEFLDESGAKTFPQKIGATGYYLTHIKGAKDFSRDEVKTALLAAREDMPGNYARDWGHATSMSLIAPEADDASRFYIPRTGRTAVESCFQEAPKRRTRRTAKKTAANSWDAE
ncbi:MAG TPA: hypothetical protein VK306_10600 [Acidimicrobiales bacterium]|nr:hypothetical protein [Acidimicrobiales bacterium]